MDFSEALRLIKQGKKMYRAEDDKDCERSLYMRDGQLYTMNGLTEEEGYWIHDGCVLAEDWEECV